MVKGYKGKDKRIHEIHKNLVGRRIVGFGWITKEESRRLNWSCLPGGTLKTSFGEGVIWVERG